LQRQGWVGDSMIFFPLLEISHSIVCGHKSKKKLLDVYLYAQEGSILLWYSAWIVGEDMSKLIILAWIFLDHTET
jgi:hypothetical protein